MANNNNEGADNTPDNSKDEGSEKSFVEKFMSGIIKSTPLSKWFGKDSSSRSVVRRRDEDDADVSFSFQPPSKRAKLPTDVERNNYSAHIFESPVTVHTSNNVNNVSSKVLGKFPEPLPGPSGIKSRKLFEKHSTSSTITMGTESFENEFETVNGEHDSDSGESTSGYSSAPKLVDKQKAEGVSNNLETSDRIVPKARSLFTSTHDSSGGRTLFADKSPHMNTSLSSRRPSFNASTFGSPNFVDRTLSTKRIMNSPFYSGRTVYGGASAYGRQLGRSSEQSNAVIRSSVQIKPVNEKLTSDNTTLSKTARRILSTLEQYSTPISDAKKIPVSPRKTGLLSSYIGATPYLMKDRKRPSNKELQVPSVPELLQMKQKEKLQTSTETVRQIATKSKSTLNKEEYKLRTEDDPKQKHSNKMKGSVASVRQKAKPIVPVDEVKLPKVSLPITTLPKFDFVLMPPSQSVETKSDTPEENKSSVVKSLTNTIIKPTVVEKKETEFKPVESSKACSYTFSQPLVILKDLKSVAAINCFKFSKPVSKKGTDTELTFKSSDSGLKNDDFRPKNNGENANVAKPGSQLLTSSVMDFFGKNKTISNQNVFASKYRWECPTCWVTNDADKTKCCACDEPKPELETKEKTGFGDKFKLSSDKWECSSCLVRNINSDVNCVACGTAKPSTDKQITKSDFGDKFKPPPSTWECTTCLIRNKNEVVNCAACGTAKAVKEPVKSSFGDKFKRSGDTWECSTCMIINKNSVDKCVACETLKPGSKTTSTEKTVPFNTSGTTFNFGIKTDWECKTCMIKNKNELKKCAACEMPRDDGDPGKAGFGDAFKTKVGEWECPSCMVKNKPTANLCVCCGINKPGNSSEKLAEITKDDEKKPVNSFNFGIDKSNATQFKFGIPTSSNVTKETTTTVSTPPTFSFGSTTKASTTSNTFTFGVNTQEKMASSKAITSTSEFATTSVSGNPLLKPSEKLPEKATAAPAGFKFGLDNSSKKNPVSETVASTSKTETTAVGSFSAGFGSTSIPTFQFKPTAINGDINKPKDGTFSSDGNQPQVFGGDLNKPKDTAFATEMSKSKESPFGKLQKSTESPFASNKLADSPFSSAEQPAGSPFGSNKPPDSPFGTTNKSADSPFAATTKSVGLPFRSTTKSVDSPFGNAGKSTDLPFGTISKPTDSPFGGMSKTAESPFGNVNKAVESPFGKPSEPVNSPFGKPTETAQLPFSIVNKPTESPFTNATDANKPKESPFGTPNNSNKSQGAVFGSVNDSNKSSESLFSSDSSKPKDILFGSKSSATSNLFTAPTSTPTFNFTPKPIENTSAPFPTAASTSQAAAPGIFKFGADASHTSVKRTLGVSSDNNISNGFGSTAKISAFGAPQSFGSAENKPFAFGTSEAAPKSSGFGFAPPEKPNAAGPVFSFGSSAPAAPAPSGGFNFSVPNTGFNFGGTPKVETPPFSVPNNNLFGSGGPVAKNGTFNFGTNANNNNQKAVFSFGANQSSQPSQSSFPTQAQSGFNFGAPTPSLNAPPAGSFNFTPSLAEGSSTLAQQPRKFKRAVRRTTPR